MTTMWRLGLCGQIKRLAYLATALAPMLLTMAGPIAAEPTYKVTKIISLPNGQQITSVDIQTVSPSLGLYAMTDRNNKAVNVFDTSSDAFVFQTTGFCGLAGATPACGGTFASEAGPNGIIFVNNKEIWAPDADSTIKVIDLATRTITKTISTGGTKRADELCHDPNTNTVLSANDRAVDNFIVFINAATYTVTKKIKLDGTGGTPNATNGIEQCQYNPRTGLFYLAIPEVNGPGNDSVAGSVLVLSPVTQSIVANFTVPLSSCSGPQGLTIGPAPQILLGCSANGVGFGVTSTVIINENNGSVIASFAGLNGNDEIYFNSTDNHYFLAQANHTGGAQVATINALTLLPGSTIKTATGDHALAADAGTGKVYVPIINTTATGICASFGGSDANGCIAVVTIVPHIAGQTSIVAAVAPNARTTNVGTVVTAFATIINAGVSAASNCSIQLPAGVPATFLYQTTDPSTNTPTGTPNTPVTIPPGASRSFYFAITPTAAFTQDIPLNFICDNTDSAPSYPGLNTFMLSVGPSLPDMLSVAVTNTNDGIMQIPTGSAGTGFFAAAAINIGAAGTVTFTPTDTPPGQFPRSEQLSLTICQTNASGACFVTPGPSATVFVSNGQTVFFSVFATGQGTALPFIPGINRVFILATQGSTVVGEADVAVKMNAEGGH